MFMHLLSSCFASVKVTHCFINANKFFDNTHKAKLMYKTRINDKSFIICLCRAYNVQ